MNEWDEFRDFAKRPINGIPVEINSSSKVLATLDDADIDRIAQRVIEHLRRAL